MIVVPNASFDRRWAAPALVALLLCSSEWLYVLFVETETISGWRSVGIFLATMAALFLTMGAAYGLWRRAGNSRAILLLVAGGGILFRLTLLPAGLTDRSTPSSLADGLAADVSGAAVAYDPFLLYDCDIWRYLWDAHLTHRLGTPYTVAPAGGETAQLAQDDFWREIRRRVQFKEIATVYPPGAQALFYVSYWIAPGSIAVFKLILILLDIGVLVLLERVLRAYRAPPAMFVLYAWNPLVIKAFAGSAHYDALLVLLLTAMLLALAKGKRLVAGSLFGLAISVKVAPLVIAPFLLRRTGMAALATGAACLTAAMVPFAFAGGLDISGIARFSESWEFNAGLYRLFRMIFDSAGVAGSPWAARLACLAVLGVLVGVLALRDRGSMRAFPGGAATALGGLILASPVINPWYTAWVMPLALAGRRPEWTGLTVLVCLSFLVMAEGTEYGAAVLAEHAAIVIWLTFASLLRQPLRFNSKGSF